MRKNFNLIWKAVIVAELMDIRAKHNSYLSICHCGYLVVSCVFI